MPTPSDEVEVLDYSDRVFHLEVLRGGMNRLLFRSNRGATWPTRVEVIFMNVSYVAVGTSSAAYGLHGSASLANMASSCRGTLLRSEVDRSFV